MAVHSTAFLLILQLIQTNPTQHTVIEYARALNGLDKANIESIPRAIASYKRFARKFSIDQRDSAFCLFREFYYEVLGNKTKSFDEDTALNRKLTEGFAFIDSKPDAKTENTVKFWEKNGAQLLFSEGMPYVDEPADFLLKKFSSFVSIPMKTFLRLRASELSEGFSEDAGLLIPFSEVANRVILWEKFNNNYPNFIMKDISVSYYRLYLQTLLTGMDNSPVFEDYGNGKLDENIRKLYKQFIKSHPKSRSAFIVSGYLKILKKNSYKWSEEADDFLRKHRLHSMSAIQPPTR
jgi:hypothetical protein